jgi:MFS family permease
MPIGAIIVGLAMLGITQITVIWQFYALRAVVVAVGFTFMGAMVTDVTISNWFIKKRGRAIALSRAGSNVSNIVLTPITVFVIASSGWRTMFVVFAILTWLVVFIPSILLMRRRPEDMGLYPDGIESVANSPDNQGSTKPPETTNLSKEPIWTRREVLVSQSFWLLSICFAINNFAFQGINISIAPYVQDLGYDDVMLASVITFRAIMMTLATLLMGFVAEHSHKAIIRASPFIIQSMGAFLFLLADNPTYLWIAVSVYGIGASGVLVTQEVVWANYFGRLTLGMVRSLGYLVAFGFGAIGPVAMNIVYDTTGSYMLAFRIITGLFIIAALLILIAKPAKSTRYTTGHPDKLSDSSNT